jgi:predicted nucleic acid-binding protein
VDRILVDTGFLVALGRTRDPLHAAARDYLERCTIGLATVSAVVVESCHFLRLEARRALLDWLASGGPAVVEVPPEAYPGLSRTMDRYRERDIDFADAALVWLAEQSGHRSILTVDDTDFRRFRLRGGARFDLVDWRAGPRDKPR